MCLDNGFDQAEAEAEAARRPALVATVETSPHVGQLVRADPDTRVADHDRHGTCDVTIGGDLYPAVRGCVLQRVVEQVRENLPEAVAIDLEREVSGHARRDLDTFFLR